MRSMFDEKMIKEMAEKVIEDFKPAKLYEHDLVITGYIHIRIISTKSTKYVQNDFKDEVSPNILSFTGNLICIKPFGFIMGNFYYARGSNAWNVFFNTIKENEDHTLSFESVNIYENFISDDVTPL